MKIERIDHLNITVSDIGRSIEFYERVLGMRTESMGEAPRRAPVRPAEDPPRPRPAHQWPMGAMSGEKRMPAHICFITETPIAAVAKASRRLRRPVRMQGPARRRNRTIQSLYIDDPDQNSIEISTY